MTGIEFFLISSILLLLSLFLLLKPRIAVYLIIFFCIFDFGYFSRWFEFSRHFARIPYFLSIPISIRLFLDFFLKKWKFYSQDKIYKICFSFTGLFLLNGIVSLLYNNGSILLGLYELRNYYLFITLIISIFLYLPNNISSKLFIKLCVLICLLQIPLTFIQFILVQFFGLKITQSTLDMASGSFSGYEVLVYFICFTIAMVLSNQIFYKKKIFAGINNYSLLIILLIPLLLSNSRSAVGFATITIFLTLMRHIYYKDFRYFLKILFVLPFTIVLLSGLFYKFFWLPRNYDINEQLSPNYVIEYFFREAKTVTSSDGARITMGRGRAVVEAFNLISNNFINLMFGMGPGATSEATFINKNGPYYQYEGPLAGINRNEVSKLLSETGFIGLSLYLLFFIKIFLIVSSIFHECYQPIVKEYAFSLISLIFLFSFYTKIFQSFFILALTALFCAMIRKEIMSFMHSKRIIQGFAIPS